MLPTGRPPRSLRSVGELSNCRFVGARSGQGHAGDDSGPGFPSTDDGEDSSQFLDPLAHADDAEVAVLPVSLALGSEARAVIGYLQKRLRGFHVNADGDPPGFGMHYRVAQGLPRHQQKRPVGFRIERTAACDFGLDLDSVFDSQFARQIEERGDRGFRRFRVPQVPDSLPGFFQRAVRLNPCMIQQGFGFRRVQAAEWAPLREASTRPRSPESRCRASRAPGGFVPSAPARTGRESAARRWRSRPKIVPAVEDQQRVEPVRSGRRRGAGLEQTAECF